MTPALLFGAVLACLAPRLVVPSPQAPAPAESPATEQDVTAQVWRLLEPQTPGKSIDEAAAARSIASLGGAAVRPTLGIYLGLVPEPDTEVEIDARSIRARPRILLSALATAPASVLLDEIDRTLASQDGVNVQLEIVRILGRTSIRGALLRVIRIASELEPTLWESSVVQEPLEVALGSLLARDKRAATQLAVRVQNVEPALGAIFVRSLVRASATQAASQLTEALGRDPRLDLCVVDAFADLGDRVSGTLTEAATGRLLFLLESENAEIVAAAARTLALLGEPECALRLVGLLEHSEPEVRAAASSGLKALTANPQAGDAAVWKARLESEALWATERLPQLAQAEIDATTLSRVVAELRQHMLYRHRGAEILTRALASKDPGIVLFACNVLPEFRSGIPRSALRALEVENDPAIRKAAHAALARAAGPQ